MKELLLLGCALSRRSKLGRRPAAFPRPLYGNLFYTTGARQVPAQRQICVTPERPCPAEPGHGYRRTRILAFSCTSCRPDRSANPLEAANCGPSIPTGNVGSPLAVPRTGM